MLKLWQKRYKNTLGKVEALSKEFKTKTSEPNGDGGGGEEAILEGFALCWMERTAAVFGRDYDEKDFFLSAATAGAKPPAPVNEGLSERKFLLTARQFTEMFCPLGGRKGEGERREGAVFEAVLTHLRRIACVMKDR